MPNGGAHGWENADRYAKEARRLRRWLYSALKVLSVRQYALEAFFVKLNGEHGVDDGNKARAWWDRQLRNEESKRERAQADREQLAEQAKTKLTAEEREALGVKQGEAVMANDDRTNVSERCCENPRLVPTGQVDSVETKGGWPVHTIRKRVTRLIVRCDNCGRVKRLAVP